jgi:uncharacterized membrane protein
MMSNLIVVADLDEYRAAVRASLCQLNDEYLIDLEDARYVTKDASGH